MDRPEARGFSRNASCAAVSILAGSAADSFLAFDAVLGFSKAVGSSSLSIATFFLLLAFFAVLFFLAGEVVASG